MIFISHTDRAEADKQFTSRLVRALQAEQIPYWIDREHPLGPEEAAPAVSGPGPGNPVFSRICEAIDQSNLLLFVFSRESVGREFVRLELDPRVLLGPGAGKSVGVVKLNEVETIAPELSFVFSAITSPREWDLAAIGFDEFFEELKDHWSSLEDAPHRTEWRAMPAFSREPAAVPSLTDDACAEAAASGRERLASGLELMRKGELDLANEAIADAYAALQSADDATGTIDALYATFEVSLLLGLQQFREDRRTLTIGGMTLMDTHLNARREIGYALEALQEAIVQAERLGDSGKAEAMRQRYDAIKPR